MTSDRTSLQPRRHPLPARMAVLALVAALMLVGHGAAAGAPAPLPAAADTTAAAGTTAAAAATDCSSPGQSGAAVPTPSSGTAAVRTTIGVAKSMGVSVKGQIVAVMVMFQESSIRNLANDGTSTQNASWPTPPGREYWINLTRLSLKYPHDRFGTRDGASDTDSIGLYQQRPSYGWGNYGSSTGTTDPEGVVQRLLDPRWEAMAFFGGTQSAAPTSGLLDVSDWESMEPTYAANAVQRSSFPSYYAKWEGPATTHVNNNQDAPAISLPWYPGGGGGALSCTSIPTDPAAGEAGRNPLGSLDLAAIDGTSIRVAGWMFDPDASNGIGQIHFYDQGPFGTTGYPTGVANQTRDDVNRAFNVLGQYGFSTMLPWTGAGGHTICAYAINVGRGTGNPQLGCRDVVVPGPIGSLDVVARNSSGQIDVTGWAADPAAPGAREEVHIYVTGPNGTQGTPGTYTGSISRPDVQQAFGWANGAQGFRTSVPAMGQGTNRVCVYAINVNPPNSNPLLGCQTVSIPYSPIGSLDAVTVSGNQARVAGWTFDPNSPASSIQVHLYVTAQSGATVGTPFVADDARGDVNAAFGINGNHGFIETVNLAPESNIVCAFGIGADINNNAQIGCMTVQSGPSAVARVAAPEPQAATESGADATGESTPAPTPPAPSPPPVTPPTSSRGNSTATPPGSTAAGSTAPASAAAASTAAGSTAPASAAPASTAAGSTAAGSTAPTSPVEDPP